MIVDDAHDVLLEEGFHGLRGVERVEADGSCHGQEQLGGELAIELGQRDQHEIGARPDVQGVLFDLEAAVDAVLAQFLLDGVDQTAFDRIKRQLRADEVYARDNVNGLAREYGAALTSGLTVADVQAWPDLLQAVTPKDVMAAAHEVLNRDNAVTGWLQRKDDSNDDTKSGVNQ